MPPVPKSPDAFRTISEVAEWLDTPAHVLRFWESKFTQVKPVKRAGGRRYYRPADMELIGGIKRLLQEVDDVPQQVNIFFFFCCRNYWRVALRGSKRQASVAASYCIW